MPSSYTEYTQNRITHWNHIARTRPAETFFSREYHRRLREIYQHLVSPGLSVLELGCGRGDLLAALSPARGVGVDFSPAMLEIARQKHPQLTFLQADAHELALEETFDVILLSDLVNDVYDVQTLLERIHPLCRPDTRLILNTYSRLHQPTLTLAGKLGFATQLLPQNWLAPEDTENLLRLAGFEVIQRLREILLPLPIPLVRDVCNKILVKLWPFNALAWTNIHIARPAPTETPVEPSVSIIIPARNEAGNIEAAFRRIPKMGRHTELIFVEGHSRDDTYTAIEQAIAAHPEWDAKLFKQCGKGKADAVRLGFEQASGEVLMILDADLTVRPEDLPRFYRALVSGKGEFINGVRLVYPMEEEAMRFLNLVGNKFFSLAFSWLLGQPIKDTLCGTKVLYKRDYERIAANRAYFGEFDPFGDYDLIFGAARQNRKIIDLPIRYQERTYGQTNIHRWRHGLLLLRMVLIAALRLKFV
ncbi:MAG: glycosyltransferase [Anaerolineales bacterium]|nr:glycosyltransferase [Anaerolineales bacterium]MCX7754234.1 glycosyltransferase [Anaerolineales bacterium]MDW8279499.1 glycosyltransferase [Anaerolineales bacterium]